MNDREKKEKKDKKGIPVFSCIPIYSILLLRRKEGQKGEEEGEERHKARTVTVSEVTISTSREAGGETRKRKVGDPASQIRPLRSDASANEDMRRSRAANSS